MQSFMKRPRASSNGRNAQRLRGTPNIDTGGAPVKLCGMRTCPPRKRFFAILISGFALSLLAPLPADLSYAAANRAEELVATALQLDADAKNGAVLYSQHCARCHGIQAQGSAFNVVPALAGQRRAYLVKQLADFIELERDGSDMHRVIPRAAVAEPQSWVNIAAFLNRLPVVASPEHGDGTGVNLGEAIFREQCASCHDKDARGDNEGFVPSLRDQHYSYLLQQIRSLAAWRRRHVDEDLVRFLDSLEPDELTAVADYLSRMTGPTRNRLKMYNDGSVGD